MQYRPIKRAGHGVMDYVLAGFQLAAPTAFGLKGPAKYLSYLFGGTQLAINAMTDQPFAAKPAVPFKMHGMLEAGQAPVLLGLPLLLGAMSTPKDRNYFLGTFAVLTVAYLATDWNAGPDKRQRPTTHAPSRMYDSERAKQFA